MKKKILVIGPGMEIGGVERSLLGLLDGIDYSKYDVDLFLFSHTGEWMNLINPNVNLLPEEKLYSLMSYHVVELLKEGHFFVALFRMWAKIYAKIRQIKYPSSGISTGYCKKVFTKMLKPQPREYDMALGFFGPHYYLKDKVQAKVKIGWVHTDYANINEKPDVNFSEPMWKGLDYIACVSEDVKISFDSVYPKFASRTIVIENILSSSFVLKQAGVFDAFKEMPQNGCCKILSVGRFSTQKNFDCVPEVCKQLIEKGYNVEWYLIGYGPDEDLIRQKITECQMENSVIILGKKNNPYPYMNACDIYVQPSRYEGKAVTVREAQMLHKPVLITRYATASSQVVEGIDGYICELSVNGIVEGISYLLNHPEICKSLSDNTKNRNYENIKDVQNIFDLGE